MSSTRTLSVISSHRLRASSPLAANVSRTRSTTSGADSSRADMFTDTSGAGRPAAAAARCQRTSASAPRSVPSRQSMTGW
jgi:hypothetical protein